MRALAHEDWLLTATAVVCWGCAEDLDHEQHRQRMQLIVEKCEYCWPPLFSDTPGPDRCRCDKHAEVTSHIQVPFLTRTHPGFEQHSCVTIRRPQCGAGLAGEDDEFGEPHFPSTAAALIRAEQTYDWLVTGTLTCCPPCARRRACATLGHQLPDPPDHITEDGIEHRWCRHCDDTVLNPMGDRDMPWL